MNFGLPVGRPPLRLSICPEVLLEFFSQFLLKVSMVLGANEQLCVAEPDFWEKS